MELPSLPLSLQVPWILALATVSLQPTRSVITTNTPDCSLHPTHSVSLQLIHSPYNQHTSLFFTTSIFCSLQPARSVSALHPTHCFLTSNTLCFLQLAHSISLQHTLFPYIQHILFLTTNTLCFLTSNTLCFLLLEQ